jgi:hypothetical protein
MFQSFITIGHKHAAHGMAVARSGRTSIQGKNIYYDCTIYAIM